MNYLSKLLRLLLIGLIIPLVLFSPSVASIVSGQKAPDFKLMDSSGEAFSLTSAQEHSLAILYFFDVSSRPSQEGMISLGDLWQKYGENDIIIWGITKGSKSQISDFIKQTKTQIPILLDDGAVHELYMANTILPTVCILGPDAKVNSFFQGGGKATEVMLVRVAENTFRTKPMLANEISKKVLQKNPQNAEARSLEGYIALRDGRSGTAEKIFKDLAQEPGVNGILGKEGLSSVYAKKGQQENALKLANEVTEKAPDRPLAHVIKGDLLASQGRNEDAQKEYQKAVEKKQGQSYQKSLAFNQLGRTYAEQGNYEDARKLYDQAIEINPLYVEATSNKGVSFEKQGRWDEALQAYQQSVSLNKDDLFSLALAQKADEMLKLQKDSSRSEQMNRLVKELSERFNKQQLASAAPQDSWTSSPMVISFVDFQEKGLAERDGTSIVLTTKLAETLSASGRVKVVDRLLIDKLLEELNLGSSELADPETSLRLGRVLAARVLGTGSMFFSPEGNLLSLRMLDTETTEIAKVFTLVLGTSNNLEGDINLLNRKILQAIIEKFPLQGYVVAPDSDRYLINIGSKQGVVTGTQFEVIEESEPIEYKGKTLQGSPKIIAEVEVVKVEDDIAYVRPLNQQRPLKADDKIREKRPAEMM